jgi:hypothetical protein
MGQMLLEGNMLSFEDGVGRHVQQWCKRSTAAVTIHEERAGVGGLGVCRSRGGTAPTPTPCLHAEPICARDLRGTCAGLCSVLAECIESNERTVLPLAPAAPCALSAAARQAVHATPDIRAGGGGRGICHSGTPRQSVWSRPRPCQAVHATPRDSHRLLAQRGPHVIQQAEARPASEPGPRARPGPLANPAHEPGPCDAAGCRAAGARPRLFCAMAGVTRAAGEGQAEGGRQRAPFA